ncbi:MAG: glutamate--tRNA ligase [Deinococcota bacterium]
MGSSAPANVVTRIAPSPTGDPHVGTAYIGLFNYAFTKQHGGRFILRIEDTDRERYSAESETRILEMMSWLGIRPDLSPEQSDDNGPYRQSERLKLYQYYANTLLEGGFAYRAFETAEELEQIKEDMRRRGIQGGYDGRARNLPSEESDRRAVAGEPFVVRLKAPLTGETAFKDELRGLVRFNNAEIRDMVLLKSDGYPTYHLANVVDDHLMGVTHVIRAEEWITSTPIHVLLYDAFSWDVPQFIHMPLLRNPDKNKTKISKRKLDTSVDSYRDQGFLPEALLNFLGNLGWSMPDGREYFNLQAMIDNFDITRVSLGAPVFDLKKLRHVNAHYIQQMDVEDLAERARPFLEAAGHTTDDEDYLLDVLYVLQPRVETLQDFVTQSRYFFSEDYGFNDDAKKKLTAGQGYISDLERELALLDSFDPDSVADAIDDYIQSRSLSKGKVLPPLRAALTGTMQSPDIIEVASILGRRRVLARLGRALQLVTSGLPDDHPIKEDKSKEDADAKQASKREAVS